MISNIDSLSKNAVVSKKKLTLLNKMDNFSSFKRITIIRQHFILSNTKR